MAKPQVKKISDNVIAIEHDVAERADPTLILENGTQGFFFRRGAERTNDAGEQLRLSYYLTAPPSELTTNDVVAINVNCDVREGARNREVKNALSQSLKQHFGPKPFHVTELGAGTAPIIPYLDDSHDVTYHGIDCDPAVVSALARAGVSASTWDGVTTKPGASERTRIGVGVYSLHFMVNQDLPQHICKVASDDGFYVGNFYIDQREQETGEQRRKLGDILRSQNMHHVVLRNPTNPTSEYWVISPNAKSSAAEEFAAVLKANDGRPNGKPPKRPVAEQPAAATARKPAPEPA